MNMSIYSLYDSVADVFNKPFTEINDNSAFRLFKNSMEDNPNKNDYVLYRLGDFDDNIGIITPTQVPVKLQSGFEIKEKNLQVPPHLQDQAS